MHAITEENPLFFLASRDVERSYTGSVWQAHLIHAKHVDILKRIGLFFLFFFFIRKRLDFVARSRGSA